MMVDRGGSRSDKGLILGLVGLVAAIGVVAVWRSRGIGGSGGPTKGEERGKEQPTSSSTPAVGGREDQTTSTSEKEINKGNGAMKKADAAANGDGSGESPSGAAAAPQSPPTPNEDPKKFFDGLVAKAKDEYKAGNFLGAAERYTAALAMCDKISGYSNRKGALYNNRAAMYEKAGDHNRSLLDCTLCLTEDPHHRLARIRKARIYESLGKFEESLTELCAHMLIDRDAYRNALQQGSSPQMPTPPERLEAVMKKLADVDADRIYEEKQQEKGPQDLPSQYATYEVLRSFESFTAMEKKFKGVSEAAIGEEIKDAGTSLSRLVSSLMDRGLTRATRRKFEEACEDVEAAYQALQSALIGATDGVEEEAWKDVSKGLLADVYAWYGTFLHLRQDLDGAQQAYTKSCEFDGSNPDVWIKRAGVEMDKDNYEKAEELFEVAMNLNVKCATTYMFRAQIHAYRGDMAKALEDIDTCLSLNPEHTSAYGRKVTMHMQLGNAEAANSCIDEALSAVPNSSDILMAKGEFLYGMAIMTGDVSSVKDALNYFDKAMASDSRNPAPYVNKGLALINTQQDLVQGIALLEKALSVDPRYQPAMAQLGNIKISVAQTFDDAADALKLFDDAIKLSRDRADIGELCQCKVAAHAKIRAAKALGYHNLM